MLAPVIYQLSAHCALGKCLNFLGKDTLFGSDAAEMHRSVAAKETVHIARYLF